MKKNKKVKVLLVSPYSAKKVGGIGTWTKNIIEYCENNQEVNLIFQNTAFYFKSNLHKNQFYRVFVGIIDSFIILLKLFTKLLIHKPDTVHYTSSASFALFKDNLAIFITRKIFKKSFIIHWHFGRIPELCELKNHEFKKLINVIQKASFSIVIDQKSYLSLIDQRIKNVVYIPNPISENLKLVSENLNVNTIQQNRKKDTVIFIGHIVRAKGVIELVKACSNCNEVKKLILIGPYIEDIKKEIELIAERKDSKDWIEFTGELRREDVNTYYLNTSIFVLPSYSEGFPFVIMEAMAFACPIIATKVGAIPEMLSNDCGICVDVKNEIQLEEKIKLLLSDKQLSNKIGENAKQKLLSEYTLEKVFNQYLNIWKL